MINANELVRAALEEAAIECERHHMLAKCRPIPATICKEYIRAIANDPEQVAAIVAKCGKVEPVAHIVERHAFRVSPDGQDAEGHDWLEVTNDGELDSFPVYAAPVVPAMDEARERALLSVVKSVASEGFHVMPGNGECKCSRCELIREARAALREGK